jgi:hypothetical protein
VARFGDRDSRVFKREGEFEVGNNGFVGWGW